MDYIKAKRIFIFLTAIALWVASFIFSVNGFNFEIAGFVWVGWVFGFTITALELAFSSEINAKGKNLTIYIFGIFAFIYGIASNFIGLWIAQGNPNLDNVGNNIFNTAFIVIIALIGEIAPEAMLVHALGVNNINGEGDALKNLFGENGLGLIGKSSGSSGAKTPMRAEAQMPPQGAVLRPNNPSGNGPGRPKTKAYNQDTTSAYTNRDED